MGWGTGGEGNQKGIVTSNAGKGNRTGDCNIFQAAKRLAQKGEGERGKTGETACLFGRKGK